MKKAIELLSPAGSLEAFHGALAGGCDAVYLGSKSFGARAYAQNFTDEELAEAIDKAHLLGVKVYCTVNTLFKNSEFDPLYSMLVNLYEIGVDAFIIQDLGLISIMRRRFPEIEIHASTQMNCHSAAYASFLQAKGFSRVVLSRELSLSQIEAIHDKTDVELETFIHGALCYCFSGQCLMSSMIGGRSGNRGRCAQPCRLPYQVEMDGKVHEKQYILSPKDIQTVNLIPKLIKAGVTSFKIEGRMKSADYVTWNTKVYRHYMDLAMAGKSEAISEEDLDAMLQLYNRGGFSDGYYMQKNGPEMIAANRPNHQGLAVGAVIGVSGNGVQVVFDTTIHHGDALLLGGSTFLCRQSYQKRSVLKMNATYIQKGDTVYRLKDVDLEARITAIRQQSNRRVKVDMSVVLEVGKPAVLALHSSGMTITSTGETVQLATGSGMDLKRLSKPFEKLNDTMFEMGQLAIKHDDAIFMPVSHLNALRRDGIEQLEAAILKKYRRKATDAEYVRNIDTGKRTRDKERNHIIISHHDQFSTVIEYPVDRIYFEMGSMEMADIDKCLEKCSENDIEAYLALPRIVRDEDGIVIRKEIERLSGSFNGFLVRSMDGYLQRPAHGKPVVFDHTLNIMNNETLAFIRELADYSGYHPSLELNRQELAGMDTAGGEVLIYGYYQVMTSQQCVYATLEGCHPGTAKKTVLIDRKNTRLKTERYCSYCQNNIYNTQPMMLMDKKQQLSEMGFTTYRYRFTDEKESEIRDTLEGKYNTLENFTRGHYNRGVE